MRVGALLGLILVLSALVPMAGPAQAEESEEELRIDVDRTIDGADIYLFSIRIDPREGDPSHFEIANGSHFTVTGHFPKDNGSVRQDTASMRGVFEYNSGLSCEPATGDYPDPCFMDAEGISIKDVGDTRVEAGGFTFQTDPNLWGWVQNTASITWDEDHRFEVPATDEQLTVRFLITIPEAAWIDVDVHIHSPQAISIHDEIVNDRGFMATSEDFEPAAAADTMAASAAVDGQQTVDLGTSGDRLYAAYGPSWFGTSAVANVAATHNTAAVSNIAYEDPDGDRISGTAIAVGTWSGILIPGSPELGTHTFEANLHAGAGPQDLYLVGYEGPTG